jgi:CheY-like chemotaxis protein
VSGNPSQTLLADLEVVLRNSQHLSGLIDDVLDLSQIEAGQMALSKERVALADIIESAVIAVRPLYASKALTLQTDIAADLPPIFCDRMRIREVVLNLLSNAGRFTEEGGVLVRAWREDAAGSTVVVSIQDTGPGIAERDKKRLFRPFQQLDNTLRRRYGGTGLGLSISKNFVELHGGKMWMESELGHGTTFFFTLPVEPPLRLDGDDVRRWFSPYETYDERQHVLHLPAMAEVSPRLIVVEAGQVMRHLLTRHLTDVEIVPCTTWEQAMAEVSHTPAQAILVNGTDVSTALSHVHSSSAPPYNVPVLVCNVPGVDQIVGDLRINGYLVKPVAREELLSALDGLNRKVETVLVVEDDPDAQRLFWRILASAGRKYRMLRAYDGQQALALLEDKQPDVILLDLTMPHTDGFQFLEVRAQAPALRDIPVFIISARDPLGHPIVSRTLAVTRTDGLSVHELLACIKAFGAIVSVGHRRAAVGAPKPPAMSPGEMACE